MLQGTDRVQDLHWAPGVTWGDLWLRNEWEWSTYNFEQAPVAELFEMFKIWEAEAARLLELKLVNPATTPSSSARMSSTCSMRAARSR
jgi:glycyl-tRNA synthetase alpha chain